MSKTLLWLGTLGSLLLMGCIPTLHPLYEAKDVEFDERLIGDWHSTEKDSWKFTRRQDNGYLFVYTDAKGREGRFDAQLVKFEGLRFLDVVPRQGQLPGNDFYKAYMFPLHTFFRIDQFDGPIVLRAMDSNWLKRYLQEHPSAVRHELIDDGILVTAKPKEMQKFLVEHKDNSDAFQGKVTLRRK